MESPKHVRIESEAPYQEPEHAIAETVGPGPRRVGVLFVHGIGEQEQSHSVRWFGDALLKWLTLWYDARFGSSVRPEVVSAALSYGADLDGPARFTIRLPASRENEPDNVDVEWLIAEAHWAERISPPSFGAMVEWVGQSAALVLRRLSRELNETLDLVRARIGRSLTQRELNAAQLEESGDTTPLQRDARPARSDPGLLAAVFELFSGTLLAALYLLSLLLLPLLLVPLVISSLIPIPAWRKFVVVELLEPFLVKGIGDFRTFIEDDVQAAHIRQGLAEDVEWLATTGACEDIIVIAHSQGAVVAFDALTTPQFPGIRNVKKLLTVGGALNNAWHLYGNSPRLRRTLPNHIHWVDFWSYYDPVAGSRLRPPQGALIVDPTVDLQKEMRWYRRYVEPGFIAETEKEKVEAPEAPMPRQVTNGMNVLTDHDGYFRNPEQFLSRVACEIDRPRQNYSKSRFANRYAKDLSKLRRTRVSTLVSWRLYAMALFGTTIAVILIRDGADTLVQAGRSIGSWINRIPGTDILGGPGALFDGVRQALQAASGNAASSGLASAFGSAATFLGHPFWGAARDFMIATLLMALVFAGAYFALTWLLYRPWDEREAKASVLDIEPTRDPADVYLRGAVVVGALILLSMAVVVL